ncbi:hypothetical protein [Aquimarina rhabdastrellae]
MCIGIYTGNAQQYTTQKELLQRYHELDSLAQLQFYDPNFNSFGKEKIEEVFSLYYEQLSLLKEIEGKEILKFKFYKQRGQLFKKIKILKESNKNFYKSIEYYNRIEGGLPQTIIDNAFGTYGEMADNYRDLNQIDSVGIQYRRGIAFSQANIKRKILRASAYNNMGIHFSETIKQYDSALFYLKEAQHEMGNIADPEFKLFEGSIRDNIANTYVGLEQLQNAKELYKVNFSFFNPKKHPQKYHDHYRWVRSGIQMAEMSIKLEEIPEAETILDSVAVLLSRYNFREKGKIKHRYLQARNTLHLLKGEYKKAYEYTLRSKEISDSMDRAKKAKEGLWNVTLKNTAITKMKEDLELEELRQHINAQKKQNRLVLVMMLLIIGIGVLGLIFNLYKKRRFLNQKDKHIAEQNVKLLDLQNEVLQKKAEIKKRDLTDFAINTSQNNEWIKEFYEQIIKVKASRGRARTKSLNELEQEIRSKIQFDESTKDFYEKIDKLSNEFYQKLKERNATLSRAEIKLCTMIRLGFDNKKIAMLQHIDPHSVHQSRYRLKKKLNIEEDLDTFLINI